MIHGQIDNDITGTRKQIRNTSICDGDHGISWPKPCGAVPNDLALLRGRDGDHFPNK